MRQIMSGNYNVRLGPTAMNNRMWAVLGDAVLTVITVAPIGDVISPARHLIVMTGATVSASFAMAAVEVAPINEEWRGPLRFAAGLAAGLRGGSVANNLTTAARTRLPLLVTRTIDLARARVALGETNALLTALPVGAPGRAALVLRQGNLTAQISTLETQITQLRALAPVQAAENTLNTRLRELADLEAQANAPGLSPSGKAARANDAAMQQARQNVRNAQQGVQEAYNTIDTAAAANPALRRFVVDPQLDNNLLSALANVNDPLHAAAVVYARANQSVGLSVNRHTFREFLQHFSKEQFRALRDEYGIRLIREISLQELEAVADRLQRAFNGTSRVLAGPDARVAASAFLRNERIATNDLRFFKRCRDLGLDVDYVGADPRWRVYVPQNVTVPAN